MNNYHSLLLLLISLQSYNEYVFPSLKDFSYVAPNMPFNSFSIKFENLFSFLNKS